MISELIVRNTIHIVNLKYQEVASRTPLVAHPRIFRLFMKGKFDALDLWPKGSKIE